MLDTAAKHPNALVLVTDVTAADQVDRLFQSTVATWGRVDVLFNNAGVSGPAAAVDEISLADDLTQREVKLSIGGSVHDPTDPVGRLLFNVLAMVAEFEADLIRARTRE